MQDNIIFEGGLSAPINCLDFGIRHEEQMELISKAQDKILQLQAGQVAFTDNNCPKCPNGILKNMVLIPRGFMMFLVIIGLPCPADDVIRATMLLLLIINNRKNYTSIPRGCPSARFFRL